MDMVGVDFSWIPDRAGMPVVSPQARDIPDRENWFSLNQRQESRTAWDMAASRGKLDPSSR